MAGEVTLQVDDLLPVRSRVNWSAVFAGAVCALAVHFVLLLFGTAIGLSVGDARDRVDADTIATTAGIWAIVATIIALFAGGWVTSQATVGENKKDAVVHGIIMWGVVFAIILWMVAAGISGGFNAMIGVATAADTQDGNWRDLAIRAGVPAETVDQWQSGANDQTEASAADSAAAPDMTREEVRQTAQQAAWWTLGATLLSMLAAIGGAVLGAGGKYHLLAVGLARETRQKPTMSSGQPATTTR